MEYSVSFILLFLALTATVAKGDIRIRDFDVRCSSEGFTVKVAKSAVKYYSADEMILNDPSCHGVEKEATYTINSAFTSCGTTRTQTDLAIIYKNVLIGKPDPPEKLITKKSDVKKAIYCIFDRNQRERLATVLQPSLPFSDTPDIKEAAPFSVSLQLSNKDGSILDSGDVLAVVAGSRVYFSLVANTDIVKVSADRCYVTPTNNPRDNLQYNLLQKGCPADNTVQDEGPLKNGHRYSFESFAFVSDKLAPLFVHCTALSCPRMESNAACVKDCSHSGMVETEEMEEGRKRKRSSKRYQPSSKRIGSLSALLVVS